VSGRRELVVAVVTAAAAGALVLVSSGQDWLRVTAEPRPPLPPVTGVLEGSEAAPLVPATGLVLLASAVALVAVSGVGRALVGLLAAVAGAAAAWSGVRALAGGLVDAATELPGVGRLPGPVTAEVTAAGPVLAVLAGVLAIAVGLFVVVRGRSWPGMGRRYERGTPLAPRTDEDRSQAAWRALDRGQDPTA
jgi:uncharacterized membrane protein (TIGR02234 family)